MNWDWQSYLFLVLLMGLFVGTVILMNTSILANKNMPELLRELWHTYFAKDHTLPDDEPPIMPPKQDE